MHQGLSQTLVSHWTVCLFRTSAEHLFSDFVVTSLHRLYVEANATGNPSKKDYLKLFVMPI